MGEEDQVQQEPVLVFDFDETLVAVDSSEWVAEQVGGAALFTTLRKSMTWHDAMNATLHMLHAQAGISIAHIQQALRRLPLHPATVAALHAAHALGCDLRIVSDANTFFIRTVLDHHSLSPLFSQVLSNPASIDSHGRLCYSSFHSHLLPPHSCPLCPSNMCKGRVIDTILQELHLQNSSASCIRRDVIYAGDGSGDLCPSLWLGEQDCVLARDGFPLSKLLSAHNVKASVRRWSSLPEALLQKLRTDYCANKVPHSLVSSLHTPEREDQQQLIIKELPSTAAYSAAVISMPTCSLAVLHV